LLLRSLFSEGDLMIRPCQHCGELILGDAYRVTSEEDGITLLDMIVCSLCSREAKKLRLHTRKMNVTSKQLSARTRGTYTTRYLI
jgi:superfamily II helicase